MGTVFRESFYPRPLSILDSISSSIWPFYTYSPWFRSLTGSVGKRTRVTRYDGWSFWYTYTYTLRYANYQTRPYTFLGYFFVTFLFVSPLPPQDYYENTFQECVNVGTRTCVCKGIATIVIMLLTLGGIVAATQKLYVFVEVCAIVTILSTAATLWCQFCANAHTLAVDLSDRLKRVGLNHSFQWRRVLRHFI